MNRRSRKYAQEARWNTCIIAGNIYRNVTGKVWESQMVDIVGAWEYKTGLRFSHNVLLILWAAYSLIGIPWVLKSKCYSMYNNFLAVTIAELYDIDMGFWFI